MALDGRPYETVPKDGRPVYLWDTDGNGPYLMSWNPFGSNALVSRGPGIWEAVGGGFTWCDEDPRGAPTHWAPAP